MIYIGLLSNQMFIRFSPLLANVNKVTGEFEFTTDYILEFQGLFKQL